MQSEQVKNQPIKLKYSLRKEDYLQHLLYSASKTPAILKKRKRNRIILPVLYLSIGIFGFINGNFPLFMALLALAALWYWAFPRWEQKQYIRQYSKYLDTQLQEEAGKDIELEFSPGQILQKESGQVFSIQYDQIRGWFETTDAVYIGLNDGYTVIIPKTGISQLAEIENIVRGNDANVVIPQIKDLNWKWQ